MKYRNSNEIKINSYISFYIILNIQIFLLQIKKKTFILFYFYFLNFKRLREVEIVLELSDQWTHRCKRKHPTLQPEAYSQIKGKQ